MRSPLLWLLLSLAVVVIVASAFRALSLSVRQLDLLKDVANQLLPQLVLPLLVLALALVELFCKGPDPHAPSKGELDILIQRKHQGALLCRSQRIRESAAKISHCAQGASRSSAVGVLLLADREGVLDRLVQLKRHGAWAPHRNQ